MRILSFDTSTESPHIALLECGHCLFEQIGPGASIPSIEEPAEPSMAEPVNPSTAEPANLSVVEPAAGAAPRAARGKTLKPAPRQETVTMLLPLIDYALKHCGWEKQSLDCLVVGAGPGSFTGIRTGIVTARTLAQALQLPLIAVSVLEAWAVAHGLPAGVALSAGRGYYFSAGYIVDEAAQRQAEQLKLELAPGVPFLQEIAAATYLPAAALEEHLAPLTRWTASDEALETFSGAGVEVTVLPKAKNIATLQGQIAWNRLSLRVSQAAAGVGGEVSQDRPVSVAGGLASRQALLALFCYRDVQPLYLRSPSVTVKTGNA